MNLIQLEANLLAVRTRMADAGLRAGRTATEVTLVAVTKRQPSEAIQALAERGVIAFGENYPQELWSKVEALSDLSLNWHHIGHLQGNKAKRTLPLVKFIHGVDSLKLLLSLEELVGSLGLTNPPAVCLQVNTSGEASKHGWSPISLLDDADAIAQIRNLPIVGLMTLGPIESEAHPTRPCFAALRETRDRLALEIGRPLPELSMGMSGDFETAIEEGATLVRVGSALFEGVSL